MSSLLSRRIVVTGMGVASPLGCGVEPVWSRLISSRSGIRRLPDDIVHNLDVKIAATVPSISEDEYGFDIDGLISLKDQRRMDRFIHLGLEAAKQAVDQAKWFPETDEQKERTATIVGSSIGGFSTIAKAVRSFDEKGQKGVSPFMIPAFLINLIAGQISIKHGFKGPIGSPTTACTASTQSIGDGLRMILSDETDIALCGGAESCIDPTMLAGFVTAGAVSTSFNDNPAAASRPFTSDRDGFVLGEGGAIIILETLEHAQARGAIPLAELIGYGTSSEAYHATACHEQGLGLQAAMRAAIRMAGITTKDIGYLNAHGTSTPLGDKGEINAIREVFGTNSGISISSTKSATGHLLGGAGSIEAIFTILALRDGILPPTLNLENPDPMCDGMDMIGPIARHKKIEYALSNSAGFGGVNASLIFKKWSA